MKDKLKKVAAFITAMFVIGTLPSCAVKINKPYDSDTNIDSDTSSTETGDQSENDKWSYVENDFYKDVSKHLKKINDADYEGTTFTIISSSPELTDPEKCGTVMSAAVYERNKLVEEKFNIEIYTKEADVDTIYVDACNAMYADSFYADLIVIPQYYIAQFASSGVLTNLQSLPFSDFDNGYNIKSGVEAGNAGSSGYAIAGWATIQPDKLPCIFFNRDLFDVAGLDYPYELVKNGDWTWDKFFEYSQIAESLNVASYGCQNTSQNMGDIVYVSCGNKFINAGEGSPATIAVEAENSSVFTDIAYKLFNENSKLKNSIEAIDTFANGGALFLIENLGEIKTLSNSNAVWGVLPVPKANSEQDNYRALASNNSAFFAIPSTCSSVEKTSNIMSALNAASLGYIADAYVNDAMYYYLRDNASIEMVEKICYAVYYDMAYSVGTYDLTIANSTYFAVRNVYENNHDINFYINSFSYRANNVLSKLFAY